MINEVLERKYEIETNKILEAIHNQAKWRNMDEENKRMMSKIERELNKEKQIKKDTWNRIFEELITCVMGFVAIAVTILLLVVLCY